MNFRPSSSFSPWLRWFNNEYGWLTELCLVWVLLKVVCSVKCRSSLSEPAAVFLIYPYLADFALWYFWCYQHQSQEKVHSWSWWEGGRDRTEREWEIEGEIERERERDWVHYLADCLSCFCLNHELVLADRKWISYRHWDWSAGFEFIEQSLRDAPGHIPSHITFWCL